MQTKNSYLTDSPVFAVVGNTLPELEITFFICLAASTVLEFAYLMAVAESGAGAQLLPLGKRDKYFITPLENLEALSIAVSDGSGGSNTKSEGDGTSSSLGKRSISL